MEARAIRQRIRRPKVELARVVVPLELVSSTSMCRGSRPRAVRTCMLKLHHLPKWSSGSKHHRTSSRHASGPAGLGRASRTCCPLRSSRTTHHPMSARYGKTGASCRSALRTWMSGCNHRGTTWRARMQFWIGPCGPTLPTTSSVGGPEKMPNKGMGAA